jgi:hypothetical protein
MGTAGTRRRNPVAGHVASLTMVHRGRITVKFIARARICALCARTCARIRLSNLSALNYERNLPGIISLQCDVTVTRGLYHRLDGLPPLTAWHDAPRGVPVLHRT